jgi:glutamate-1-semialdehyde 2,1-aminomutase
MDFSSSRRLVEEGSRFVAGGVNSNFRYGTPPNPLVFVRGQGSKLTDVDGNVFIDYYLGMGAMLLGHSPKSVVQAASQQIKRSLLVAGQTPLEYQAAQRLSELVPSAELIRFTSSGTEAIQAAFRIARATTKRMKIIKFEGHYHGWTDNTLISVSPELSQAGDALHPNAVLGSEGQERTENIIVLPWNNIEVLEKVLRSREIAAIITEPIMFNNGGIIPKAGYLERMKELCEQTGTVQSQVSANFLIQ